MRNPTQQAQLFFIVILFSTLSAAATQNEVLGTCVNQAGDGLIEISVQDGKYVGTIVGSTDPNRTKRKDVNNPDPKLRTRTLKGVMILGDLSYQGENEWDGGWIYDPNNGEMYQCKMTLEDKNTLAIRGFIGFSLFGRTEIWKRKTNH